MVYTFFDITLQKRKMLCFLDSKKVENVFSNYGYDIIRQSRRLAYIT